MRKSLIITEEMLISEVIKEYPETIPIFLEHGLHCVGCSFAKDETLKEAAKAHQIDLEKLLKDLNKTRK